jgi:hypothetical protein
MLAACWCWSRYIDEVQRVPGLGRRQPSHDSWRGGAALRLEATHPRQRGVSADPPPKSKHQTKRPRAHLRDPVSHFGCRLSVGFRVSAPRYRWLLVPSLVAMFLSTLARLGPGSTSRPLPSISTGKSSGKGLEPHLTLSKAVAPANRHPPQRCLYQCHCQRQSEISRHCVDLSSPGTPPPPILWST